jgi:hypothetical protein
MPATGGAVGGSLGKERLKHVENLQETIDFPIKIMRLSCRCSLKPIHWNMNLKQNNVIYIFVICVQLLIIMLIYWCYTTLYNYLYAISMLFRGAHLAGNADGNYYGIPLPGK